MRGPFNPNMEQDDRRFHPDYVNDEGVVVQGTEKSDFLNMLLEEFRELFDSAEMEFDDEQNDQLKQVFSKFTDKAAARVDELFSRILTVSDKSLNFKKSVNTEGSVDAGTNITARSDARIAGKIDCHNDVTAYSNSGSRVSLKGVSDHLAYVGNLISTKLITINKESLAQAGGHDFEFVLASFRVPAYCRFWIRFQAFHYNDGSKSWSLIRSIGAEILILSNPYPGEDWSGDRINEITSDDRDLGYKSIYCGNFRGWFNIKLLKTGKALLTNDRVHDNRTLDEEISSGKWFWKVEVRNLG